MSALSFLLVAILFASKLSCAEDGERADYRRWAVIASLELPPDGLPDLWL